MPNSGPESTLGETDADGSSGQSGAGDQDVIETEPNETEPSDQQNGDPDVTESEGTEPDNNEQSGTDSSNTVDQPNILLVITDDQGIDASAQYSLSNDLPNTPVINSLARNGITYQNVWGTPSCSTTCAALLTPASMV